MTEWIDLSRPLSPDVPATDVQPDLSFETVFDVETDGINVQCVCTPTHTGTTHVDAPLHFDSEGLTTWPWTGSWARRSSLTCASPRRAKSNVRRSRRRSGSSNWGRRCCVWTRRARTCHGSGDPTTGGIRWHRTLLENGVLIAEHLTNVADLAGTRADVIGLPVAIEGGDAAPARFVANVDSIR